VASFPKESRLLNSQDFNYLRKGASVVNTPFLRFYVKKSRHEDSASRLGLSVSRKVGNAVQRNIVKRTLRECFRRNSDLRQRGEDLLIVASPRLKSVFKEDKDKAREEVYKSWKKAMERLGSV
jgi:ribonuclease P protein component